MKLGPVHVLLKPVWIANLNKTTCYSIWYLARVKSDIPCNLYIQILFTELACYGICGLEITKGGNFTDIA